MADKCRVVIRRLPVPDKHAPRQGAYLVRRRIHDLNARNICDIRWFTRQTGYPGEQAASLWGGCIFIDRRDLQLHMGPHCLGCLEPRIEREAQTLETESIVPVGAVRDFPITRACDGGIRGLAKPLDIVNRGWSRPLAGLCQFEIDILGKSFCNVVGSREGGAASEYGR